MIDLSYFGRVSLGRCKSANVLLVHNLYLEVHLLFVYSVI